MRVATIKAVLLWVAVGTAAGCLGAADEAATGTVSIHLAGTAPSGTVYRLRDATITVDGPTSTVFHTEDAPDRTSLSADVEPGTYTATVQPGWRLERVASTGAVPVAASLISDNPATFFVADDQRTTVPLRFHVDAQDVDMNQGYDLVLEVDETTTGGYQALDAPSERERLEYDPVHHAVYAVNVVDQEIERFQLSNGLWSAMASRSVPALTDIAITPDHQTLIVLDRNQISEIALTDASFTPVGRAGNPDPFCGGFFDRAAAGSNGKVFIAFNLAACSGFSTSYIYDVTSHTLDSIWVLYRGFAAASADGSRIYAGSNGISPPDNVIIYNPQSNSTAVSSLHLNLGAATVSGDASRVILQNTSVYSRSLTALGNLPPGGVALASRDSSRAFVYREDESGPALAVYDLNGPLQPGAVYPLLRTIQLPDAPNAESGRLGAISMTSNADDTQVFVSGNRRLLVVPVN